MSEPLPDITLTISIQRPSEQNPQGYLAMMVHQTGTQLGEDASDGPCNAATLGNIITDIANYFEHGKKSADPTTWQQKAKAKKFNPGPRPI